MHTVLPKDDIYTKYRYSYIVLYAIYTWYNGNAPSIPNRTFVDNQLKTLGISTL